jgi:hypothetical protein
MALVIQRLIPMEKDVPVLFGDPNAARASFRIDLERLTASLAIWREDNSHGRMVRDCRRGLPIGAHCPMIMDHERLGKTVVRTFHRVRWS